MIHVLLMPRPLSKWIHEIFVGYACRDGEVEDVEYTPQTLRVNRSGFTFSRLSRLHGGAREPAKRLPFGCTLGHGVQVADYGLLSAGCGYRASGHFSVPYAQKICLAAFAPLTLFIFFQTLCFWPPKSR